jgi:hypothetical protein
LVTLIGTKNLQVFLTSKKKPDKFKLAGFFI